MDSCQAAMASSNSSCGRLSLARHQKLKKRPTEVIVRDAEVEEGTGISFDLYAAFVELFGSLEVIFLEFLGALLKALHRLSLRGIRGGRVWRHRSRPS